MIVTHIRRYCERCKACSAGNGFNGATLLGTFSLLIGMGVLSGPMAIALDGKQAVMPDRADQSSQPGTKPKLTRPLAISKLKASGISGTERMALATKYSVKKPVKAEYRKGLRRDVVIVKFIDGAKVREDNASTERLAKTDKATVFSRLDELKPQLATLDEYDRELLKRRNMTPADADGQMHKVREALKKRGIRHWRKVFRIDDDLLGKFRINTEIRKKRQSSDLSNYYVFHLEEGEQGELLVDRLNELDVVELAYLPPIPEDADVPPVTPSFQSRQTYLDPSPGGIDAKYAWTIPGGTGSQVKIIDVESGWNLNHEDLPSVFLNDGRIDDDDSRQHGTAVLGVMLGRQDGIGVSGIVPNASGGVVSVNRGLGLSYYKNVAEAVLIASMNLSEGDVILIEQHSRGPGNDGDCTACITSGTPRDQCGFIAMEYWNDIFDAVNAATASGIIVVEAAGNGEMNLDNERYDDRFNRIIRNSGALFVGAGDSVAHKPWCWSNHGSRVDVQGWGDSVMTAGYGSATMFKVNGADDNQWYTSSFSGTSSATPIVAGAVAAIQGIQIERNNRPLDWYEMADLLVQTGTPQTGEKNIGPLPDLKQAIAKLSPPTPENAVYETVISFNPASVDADRAVSGFKGERTNTIGNTAQVAAIERLQFGEHSDEPCYVKVEKADMVAHSISKPHAELNICDGNGPTDRSLQYVPTVTPDHDTFVRGVAACNSTTKNSTRLKGIKVYRARVEDDGSFSMISNPSTLERPNCDDTWHEPAMCPSGTLATDLVVHIRPDGKKDVFTGLSLKCRKVEVTRTCISGC
ncbi:MAG: S8 family serine peptidase [Nitrospira sp.]|nr:S8 family serine peptidase [Nitrospira sp.]